MHRVAVSCAILVAAAWSPLPAQAPATADLWRVTATSLPTPPALQGGATGRFWNPGAGPQRNGLAVAVAVIHTSDILGLSGLLAGVSLPVAPGLQVGTVVGRMQFRDLVRTTTSPDTEDGAIPVYEQLAGLTAVLARGPVQIGAVLELHNARLDTDNATGLTADLGVRFMPASRITVAAATHFLPVSFSRETTTDYYVAAEYVAARRLPADGLHGDLTLRYGATVGASGGLDHTLGAGLALEGTVVIDAAVTREQAYGGQAWRPALGIAVVFGHYRVAFAHGAGLNDVGGTYRVSLEFESGR